MGLANLAPTVASLHRNNGKLDQGEGTLDGSGYLLVTLDIKAKVTIVVPSSDKSLGSGHGQSKSASALVRSLEHLQIHPRKS